MPEGDAIFRTARTLARALAQTRVERFLSVLPHLTRVDEDEPIAGRTVERVRAAGKHLLIEFSGELTLRTHMRMNGSWHVYRRGERWRRPRTQMRILIATADWEAVAFNVPDAEFRRTATLEPGGGATGVPLRAAHDPLATLGPDILDPRFPLEEAVGRVRAASGGAGEVLLDQRVVASIGNVYKSEVCFVCRVNPYTPMSALTDAQIERLVSEARRLMLANVAPEAAGRIVTRRTLRAVSGRFGREEGLWVYGRAGRPCHRCGTPIRRDTRGEFGRVTYWCPTCAPE